jgi:hypothetical protein
MSDLNQNPDQNESINKAIQFGEEITMMQCGFSFHPIIGLEMEIDDSVYMYSDDGNLEINLIGGTLDEKTSIAEINDALAADVLGNVDSFELIESGTDSIQGVRGFLNEVHYIDADQEGVGKAIICSPHLNHFFFLLVIASGDYWELKGQSIFEMLKGSIKFHPQFLADDIHKEIGSYSDLTIETYEFIKPEEDFSLSIEKGDISFLLAARAYTEKDLVKLTQMTAPDGTPLYRYRPETGDFSSSIFEGPLIGTHGELPIFFPRDNQKSLIPGNYLFTFSTQSGEGLSEIQIVLRSGRASDMQTFDINIWMAVNDDAIYNQESLEQLELELSQALQERMRPFNLAPGKITFIQPAMDEVEAFSSIDIQTDLADCSYMIAENVDNLRGFNVGLVEHIYDSQQQEGSKITAISSGAPGMILSTTSPHSCVLIEWPAVKNDIRRLAESILEQLVIFSGIDTHDVQSSQEQKWQINHEIAWRIRRHPLFHDPN